MPPTPSIDPSLKVVKEFAYRGAMRLFSNRYYFDNLKPADNTKWTALADAVTTAEKAVYGTGVCTIKAVYGYDAGSDVPVFTKTYSLAGTGGWFASPLATGDSCALVRWTTAAKTSKNHTIYLFSYIHGVHTNNAADGDLMNTSQRTAFNTYAQAWITGFSDGSVTHHRCGPQGHVATAYFVDDHIRHRDFPAA